MEIYAVELQGTFDQTMPGQIVHSRMLQLPQ